MEFWCFNVLENKVETKDPSGYVVVHGAILFSGLTLEVCKGKALIVYPEATFKDNCGWIFEGEEDKLYNPDFTSLIEYTEHLRNSNSKVIK